MTGGPPKYVVTISAMALHQLEEACAYIHAQGAPLAAQRMAARLLAAIETLEQQPARGRQVSGGVYKLVTIRPYIIRYRVRGTAVDVIRIRHGARRPGQP